MTQVDGTNPVAVKDSRAMYKRHIRLIQATLERRTTKAEYMEAAKQADVPAAHAESSWKIFFSEAEN